MKFKKILELLDPLRSCKKYRIPTWQCPQFLFLLMGLIIIGVIIATYFIAILKIGDPRMVSLFVLAVGGALIVIDYIITNSFERIAEASRMKTEFISVVSHQLRSPLTNLRYSLELLISGKLGNKKKEKEYYKILEENTQRMGDLINDLLTVSRIETGRLSFKKEEISLVDLTKKIILKFKTLAEGVNVKIEFSAPKNLPKVLADSLWLEQVVENLLDNAIRYIKNGGKVKIKLRPKNKKIYFEIQDNGVGIPKEEQKFIFQKFFRSRNVLKCQTEGSGLGLYITKQVLKLFGGEIWFKSEEGKGSTFSFSLPIKENKTKVQK
ncbi:MAG TPA: HAMP domain-containing histidine kinase [Candidatus Atribacteria bacterium]|nr:HAMP domain-containing histidine kinase [Candidatus Atribacteria bacterium]